MYSIAAFHFIASVSDAPVYEHRKQLTQRGLGRVTTMESRCEEEWIRAQTLIQSHSTALYEVLQQTYQELWERSMQGYADAKLQLSLTRANFERLVQDREFQLNAKDSDICEREDALSPFRVMVSDCRLTVVEAVLSNFRLLSKDREGLERLVKEQSEIGRVDVAHEVGVYAKELGYPVEDFGEAARQWMEDANQQLLSLLTYRENETSCLSYGLVKVKSGEYDKAISEFEKGRTMLNQRNLQGSKLWLQLSNSLSEAYHQIHMYMECMSVCEEVLHTYPSHTHHFELWRAVFFLSESLYTQGPCSRGYTVVREWREKLETESPLCQCVSLCTQAHMLSVKGEKREAIRKYEAGLILGRTVIPHTYLTAYCRMDLGFLYADDTRKEDQYLQACSVYSVLCPFSLSHCINLNNLGGHYLRTNHFPSSEEKLTQAYSILSTHYLDSYACGQCLYIQGCLYETTNRSDIAVPKLSQALPLLRKSLQSWVSRCEAALNRLRRN